MSPFDLARFGGEPERLRCNAEQTRRLVQIKPWLVAIRRRPKDRDLMMRPERGDPLPCPAESLALSNKLNLETQLHKLEAAPSSVIAPAGNRSERLSILQFG